jgi:acrylyl-CoA reductase (NADPH)
MTTDPRAPFRALVVRETEGVRSAKVEELTLDALPPGDVTVAVVRSSLNYKDGLAVTGKGKVLRRLPMVPGIDLSGTVISSDAPGFSQGDLVLVTGYGVGEETFGGYAERARVKAGFVIPLPAGLDPRRAMAIGTAGLTAMLCATALEGAGVSPSGPEVLVTGAAGGVGSIAVALLARLGYRVAASTGRPEERPFLEALGASRVVDRALFSTDSGRPLEKESFGGAVDTVGGVTLATVLKQIAWGGAVAACGLAGGADLPGTVLPFILRNVSLLGIDSVHCPRENRLRAWKRLADLLPAALVDGLLTEIGLGDVPEYSERILAGRVRGRVVIDVTR